MFTRLQSLSNWFTYSVLNLEATTHITQALNFFIYDTIKIGLLLICIVLIMTLVNSYLPMEKIRDFLTKRKLFWLEYFFSSLFGAVTPFCTCSSIPLFVGFLKAGIPLGVTFAFLITSPLVNEVAVALLLWIFGIKVTVIYVISGLAMGMVWWIVLWKLKLEKYLADFIQAKRSNQHIYISEKGISFNERIKTVAKEAWGITKKVIPYVIIWVAVWAVIHGFVPTGFFEQYITKGNPLAVPVAVLAGIPMYANATSVIPIVQALIAKWVPLWTWLAFMMAVVWLSLPEFLILKKVMKTELLFLFFGVVGFCIILLGYFYNIIL